MNWDAIGAIGELVAAAATLATLVFLAIQIRHNTESVETQAELNLSDRLSDWAKEVVENPSLALLWNQAAREPDSLDEQQRMVLLWFVFQLFLIVEGHYQLYARGRISERAFTAKAETALGMLQNPHVRVWWDEKVAPLDPEFVDHMNERMRSTTVEWKYQDIDALMQKRT